ncbi:Pre-mRNA-splicing factor like [Heracleum sosnowskyi]|uniref:Pre-mRNA-splicing factor like n=1 Tax=Heracleum sosnowskyi TaxID=360622 RepID=A0AAD8IMR7_9APIA|nr:Pre-mRNA-splicing factor like [Heracleum sosnowskyi]
MSSISTPEVYYPSQDDLIYEEELNSNPFSLKLWLSYLIACTDSPFEKRRLIYERALKALPGSYKLWYAYLRERLEFVRNFPITHYGLGELYGAVSQRGVPIETSLRVHRRYLKYDPGHVEEFIEFLVESELWQEAAERLHTALFNSIKGGGKTKHTLWLELCDLLTQNANQISGLNVDAIIRGGISKFTCEVGRLWTSLADYYIKRKLLIKARDVFEEGMTRVMTVRDFSVIFDAYSQFEESMLALKMEEDISDNEEEDEEGSVVVDEEDDRLNVGNMKLKIKRLWLSDDKDVNLGLARLEHLMDRRPELANSVLLRQNPHNVEQWHRRVKIFQGNPVRQLETYTQAVRTIDPMKAVGKPHTLWVALAKLFETHNGITDARVIFDEAVQVGYRAVDDLASVWCEWAEMELRHKNFKVALEVMTRATAEPSVEVKRRVAADGNEPVQMKLRKSLRLWTFYVDLVESLGTLEPTRAVYDRILDLRIATPQIIINYALLLEDHNYFEDAFKVYEQGVKIFKYPHVKDIWVTYLSKFVKRYGKSKLERARELFEHAIEMAPAESVKPLYLQYAKLEEDHGLAKRAMTVYDRATKAVTATEKLSMYQIYIARVAEIFGVPKTREIYEQAIGSGLPDNDTKTMCIRYAQLEKKLGEIDRSRGIYKHASEFADPRSDADFWSKWQEFEVHHGNESTFREMLLIKRSVAAKYSQFLRVPEYMIQKDEKPNSEKAMDSTWMLGFADNNEDIELPDENDSEDEGNVEITQKDMPETVHGGIRKRAEEDEDPDRDRENLGARIKRTKRA